MDEKTFLRELAAEAHRLEGRVGDVRDGVWRRINEEKAETDFTATGGAECASQWFLKLDLAAAALVVAGAGLVYGVATGMLSDLYWSGSTYSIFTFF